jgi:hypothetical protein
MARGAAIFGRSIGRHAESIAPLTRCATADPKDSGTTFQLAQSPAWNGRRNVALETYGRDDVLAGKGAACYLIPPVCGSSFVRSLAG